MLAASRIVNALLDFEPREQKEQDWGNGKKQTYTETKTEDKAIDYLSNIIRDVLRSFVPPHAKHAIETKIPKLINMLQFEMKAAVSYNVNGKPIIMFLTMGSEGVQRILFGFILYQLWRDLEYFIIWQHLPDPSKVTEPSIVFPQDDFTKKFSLN